MEKEQVITELRKLTGKKFITLSRRGNVAIKHALEIAKSRDYATLLIPDQGMWMTCKESAQKAGLRIVELPTDDGIINLEELKEYRECALMLQTYAGYFARQDMEQIKDICKENELLLIEDATPALGDKLYGDIIIASFGKWKPVNLGTGGMIAHNYPKIEIAESFEGNHEQLMKKLEELPMRMQKLKKVCNLTKHDLSQFNVLHKDRQGINVVVAYDSEDQKNYILNYCDKMRFEYTECPRYIRVNRQAISIEIKRIE
jgi:hypothetical protein